MKNFKILTFNENSTLSCILCNTIWASPYASISQPIRVQGAPTTKIEQQIPYFTELFFNHKICFLGSTCGDQSSGWEALCSSCRLGFIVFEETEIYRQ